MRGHEGRKFGNFDKLSSFCQSLNNFCERKGKVVAESEYWEKQQCSIINPYFELWLVG